INAITHGNRRIVSEAQEQSQVIEEKLSIGIGERDALTASSFEAGAQRRAIALICCVAYESNAACAIQVSNDLFDRRAGPIAAAVVHNDNLIGNGETSQCNVSLANGLGNAVPFVISWENQRKIASGRIWTIHGP